LKIIHDGLDLFFNEAYSYIEDFHPFVLRTIKGCAALGLNSFIKSCLRLLRLARKPRRTELWLTIKICSAGIILIGMIGFVIKLLSAFISGAFPG